LIQEITVLDRYPKAIGVLIASHHPRGHWQIRGRIRQNRRIFFLGLYEDGPMPETLEPVEREQKPSAPVTSPVHRGRRHKRKRRLSAHQKELRFFGVIAVIVLFASFLALLWWLNRAY